MANKFRVFLFILILIIFQSVWDVRLFSVKPDFVLISTVFCGLIRGPMFASGFGLCAGLLLDLISFGPVGLSAFCLSVTGQAVGNVKEYIFQENAAAQILLSFAACLFYGLLYIIILNILAKVYVLSMFWKIAFPTAIYTALISPIVFILLSKLDFLTTQI